jgi:hypothetical protein
LQILPSGMPLLDPSERLGSKRMEEILHELRNIAEIIIFDTPPVLVFADAIVLSRRVDGVIVVIQAGKSKRAAIVQTLFDLQNANANLLGSIFNQSPQSDAFSVNKAYMQERPQLPSPRTPAKKETAGSGQFHDLRDAARPLSGSLELKSEESSTKATQVYDLKEVGEPERKEEVVNSRDVVTPLNENLEAVSEESSVKMTQIHGASDVVETEQKEEVFSSYVAATSESLELVNDETVVEEPRLHELAQSAEVEQIDEGFDLYSLESGTEVKETELAAPHPQDAKIVEAKSRKRRSRKNRNNGHKNEEVNEQISSLIDTKAHFPKNGKTHDLANKEAKDPTTALVDQTKE